ncbi:DUF4350 domain-containing protein [Amphibacillus cookii]|uniref:DUF4350 domain-containing protein n=1 Tax=Amphibacillus cookii TaxID=767787 RepID=UPI0019593373|nr:DUF4350 domain-containing protein [Amphibacillus cookii]MBM7542083.1 hypothetical protein [Amphibacillus cookii]
MWNRLKQNKMLLLFLGLFSVLIIASYYLTDEPLEDYPSYHVESPAPDGVRGFYQTLDQLNYPVQYYDQRINQWQDPTDTVLFLFDPPFHLDEQAISDYEAFLNAGGTIYYIAKDPSLTFNLDTNRALNLEEELTVEIGNQQYQALSHSGHRIDLFPNDDVLAQDQAGAIAVARRYGQGELVVITEPDWFTNQMILEAEHLDIITETVDLSTTHILFDTYQHIYETSSPLIEVYPAPFIMLALGLALVTLLYLWMNGKRFGMARELREQKVRFGDERIRALANWQIRGKNYREALVVQVDYLKQLIFEKTGTPVTASWSQYEQVLVRLLKQRSLESIQSFTAKLVEQLEQENINKQQFIEWTKYINQIRREVEQE